MKEERILGNISILIEIFENAGANVCVITIYTYAFTCVKLFDCVLDLGFSSLQVIKTKIRQLPHQSYCTGVQRVITNGPF